MANKQFSKVKPTRDARYSAHIKAAQINRQAISDDTPAYSNDHVHARSIFESITRRDKSKLEPIELPAPGVWQTADRRLIRITAMSNRHIANAINLLARRGRRCLDLENEILKRHKKYLEDTGASSYSAAGATLRAKLLT